MVTKKDSNIRTIIACGATDHVAEEVERALEDAGIYMGLCDGRPEYGRFVVESFKKITEKEKKVGSGKNK